MRHDRIMNEVCFEIILNMYVLQLGKYPLIKIAQCISLSAFWSCATLLFMNDRKECGMKDEVWGMLLFCGGTDGMIVFFLFSLFYIQIKIFFMRKLESLRCKTDK